MMDFSYLLQILLRRKWHIAGVMALAALATFYFVSQKPKRFKSSVVMATGIVNYKGINSDNSDAFVQQYQVENAFSNMLEFAQSRGALKLVTISMLQREFRAEKNNESTFRTANRGLSDFTDSEKQSLSTELLAIQLDSLTDPSFSPQFDFLLDKIARAYGYDNDALLRSLSVKRKGQTDYLDISVTTENPALSQYLANTYSDRFMRYYFNLLVREKRKNVESYAKLTAEKKAVVDSISDLKFAYLKQKGLPVLGKQSEELVGQITKLELERQRAAAKKASAGESVSRIKKYESDRESRDAREVQSRLLDKNATVEQMERVRELTRKSAESGGKNADIEAELAEAKAELEDVMRSSARSQAKPRSEEAKKTREDLYKERVSADLERIDAEESYNKANNEIYALRNKLSAMVVSDEVFSKLQMDQNKAELEFDRVNDEYIKAKLTLENAENPLSIVQNATLPEWPEPSRRALLSIFSAIVAGTLAVIAVFLLAYMDNTVQTPELFKKYTDGLPLVGIVPTVPLKGFDPAAIFSSQKPDAAQTAFRESIRKLRGELLAVAKGDQNILVTSTKSKEGKTFVALSLAHSLAFNNKRVLLLDTNFKSPLPEAFADQPSENQAFLNEALDKHRLGDVFQRKSQKAPEGEGSLVDVLGNTGTHRSPAELLDESDFRAFLAELGQRYDFVLMEAAALNQFSDGRELAPFADRVLAVFNAHSAIGQADRESVAYLRALEGKFIGAVLTEVTNGKS
jgi:Mrp family chromosome partitioning ATPase/uncharacterized protein involved in exopolysaccharide biosynthesis